MAATTICNTIKVHNIPNTNKFAFPSLYARQRGIPRATISFSSTNSTFAGNNLLCFAKPSKLRSRKNGGPIRCQASGGNEGIAQEEFTEMAGQATETFTQGQPKEVLEQKIRIKLKSYWVPLIEESVKLILDSARSTGAKTLGPIPLPTRRRIYCVLTSPHVHKDAREHFQKKTHQRLIDIENINVRTIDALMGLNIPPGVDVEVKLK